MNCSAGPADADYTLNALMRPSYDTALQLASGAQLPRPLAALARKGFMREGERLVVRQRVGTAGSPVTWDRVRAGVVAAS